MEIMEVPSHDDVSASIPKQESLWGNSQYWGISLRKTKKPITKDLRDYDAILFNQDN
ncbi:uncharacterized protein K452DRAFT_282095, partial [Aplosporella prunicola CBS 121167]